MAFSYVKILLRKILHPTPYTLLPAGGFTLIELLVVIGVIGILASGVLVAMDPKEQTDRARDAQRQQNINLLAKQLVEHLNNNNGAFPTANATWNTALVPAGNSNSFLKAFPGEVVGSTAATRCTGFRINETYCYQLSGSNAIVYTVMVSKNMNRTCTTAGQRMHYWWRSDLEQFNSGCRSTSAALTPTNP